MSSFTIATKSLQNMIKKVCKCVSPPTNNVITTLLNVVLDNGVLMISKTDSRNFLTITENNVTGDDCEFTIGSDSFSQIVSKITTQDVTVSKEDNCVVVKGNGTYKIEIQLDGDGCELDYPRYNVKLPTHSGTIKPSAIRNILVYNKPTVCDVKSVNIIALTGYYCTSDSVLTSDSCRICITDNPLFDTDVLMDATTMDLLGLFDSDFSYEMDDDCAVFTSDSIRLFTSFMNERLEEFPVQKCELFAESSFPASCVVSKSALTAAINRISLFIKQNDRDVIRFNFVRDGIILESPDRTAVESINYMSVSDFKEFSCNVPKASISKMFAARSGETVNIYYGEDAFMSVKDDDAVQITALIR